jgi:hypothetical protein
MTELTKPSKSAKKPYRSPVLTVYGSVKELTGAVSLGTFTDATNMMVTMSDPALKENIERIGEHPVGFGLYLFDYKQEFISFGAGRQFGVMADEVERFVPEAVTVGAHGYRTVNYALLGITRQ